eukprot:1150097-Pelagomonas_calceolata.AAC.1
MQHRRALKSYSAQWNLAGFAVCLRAYPAQLGAHSSFSHHASATTPIASATLESTLECHCHASASNTTCQIRHHIRAPECLLRATVMQAPPTPRAKYDTTFVPSSATVMQVPPTPRAKYNTTSVPLSASPSCKCLQHHVPNTTPHSVPQGVFESHCHASASNTTCQTRHLICALECLSVMQVPPTP